MPSAQGHRSGRQQQRGALSILQPSGFLNGRGADQEGRSGAGGQRDGCGACWRVRSAYQAGRPSEGRRKAQDGRKAWTWDFTREAAGRPSAAKIGGKACTSAGHGCGRRERAAAAARPPRLRGRSEPDGERGRRDFSRCAALPGFFLRGKFATDTNLPAAAAARRVLYP